MDDSLKKTAELAYQCFRDGWATGNWEPYIEMLADDFTFQFPAGPFNGRHLPPDGKRLMTEWARGYAKSSDRINIQPNLKLLADDGERIAGGFFVKTVRVLKAGFLTKAPKRSL